MINVILLIEIYRTRVRAAEVKIQSTVDFWDEGDELSDIEGVVVFFVVVNVVDVKGIKVWTACKNTKW